MKSNLVRIGTRKSALAVRQTQTVADAIRMVNPELEIELVELTTTGDFRRDKLNLQVLDKKQWIIELEHAILNDKIDLAVHSGKDVPLNLELGTSICSVLEREDARDVLISIFQEPILDTKTPLNFLSMGAKVGTSSKRRKSQLLKLRPDLEVSQCRGNITTRIEKVLDNKEYDAIVIGQAGVNRLAIERGVYMPFSVEDMVPAVCQGTLVAQYRSEDSKLKDILSSMSVPTVQEAFQMERMLIEDLGADCHSSLGVYAKSIGNMVTIVSRICSSDGSKHVEGQREGDRNEAISLVQSLVTDLKQKGGLELLRG